MIEYINDKYTGKVEDFLVFFRKELAYECEHLDLSEYETFLYIAKMIIDLLERLHDIKDKDAIINVEEHPMGGFIITDAEEED